MFTRKCLFPFLIALLLFHSLTACTIPPDPVEWQETEDNLAILDFTAGEAVATAGIITLPETVKGIDAVIKGQPNTFVYLQESGNYLLGWARGSDWAVIELTPDGFFARHLGDLYRARGVDTVKLSNVLKFPGGTFISPTSIVATALQALQGFLLWASTAIMDIVPVIVVLPSPLQMGSSPYYGEWDG